MSRRRAWRRGFAATVVVHLAVLYWPRSVTQAEGLPWDKLGHAVIFGAVAYAGVRAGVPGRALLAALLAHAVLSEALQQWWLPQRSGDPLDSVADAVGALAGAWLAVRRRPDDRG